MPQYVAPIVVFLCHETCPSNGDVYEAAGGFFGKYRWQRSKGKVFADPNSVTLEHIRDSWNEVTNMNDYSSPASMQGELTNVMLPLGMTNCLRIDHTFKLISQLRHEDFPDNQQSDQVSAEDSHLKQLVTSYTAQDVILYALSGAIQCSYLDN